MGLFPVDVMSVDSSIEIVVSKIISFIDGDGVMNSAETAAKRRFSVLDV